MEKPSIPKGTRDFLPEEMVKRNYVFDTIKSVFQKYAYMPIETPAMENLSTLLGKYGDEGDKLLFKILNSGDFLSKVRDDDYHKKDLNKLSAKISEKGLRFDLTVPFARYVVQNRNEIIFPFKRYQIQPVWRADKPQRGRYREFYQCDVDVIGSDSLLNEVELLQIINEVFEKLGISITTKLNNRKILLGLAEITNTSDKFIDITVAIDKFEKIGIENVCKELASKAIPEKAIQTIKSVITSKKTKFFEQIKELKELLADSEIGKEGIEEVEEIYSYTKTFTEKELFELDMTLARGLNYYTGSIFEVVANDVKMGSICGGGRYDDLTGIFGMPDVSGVGISFGADRIFDVLMELDKFPPESSKTTQLFFVNFGKKEAKHCLPLLAKARKEGIIAELYPQAVKIKKQMTYANKLNIPYVVIIGEEEIKSGLYTFKNMHSGEQKHLSFRDIIEDLKSE
ncbi:MAG: histidine--tRNA ligase [Bacteroidota bacterium]|nr:histidine--tRNA ligase [Bacteroidota bacterium]